MSTPWRRTSSRASAAPRRSGRPRGTASGRKSRYAHDANVSRPARPTASSTRSSSPRKTTGPAARQRVESLADDRGDRCALPGRPARPQTRKAASSTPRAAAPPHRGAQADRVGPDAEGRATDPEDPGDGEAARGLLDVEALEQVERAEPDEQEHREPQRALAAAPEVRRGHQQQQRGRHGGGMGDPQRGERSHLEKQVVAPGDVRRDRGGQVHQSREHGQDRSEPRQRREALHTGQRRRTGVQAEAPCSGVAAGGEEVVPVLRDEPEAAEAIASAVTRCSIRSNASAPARASRTASAEVPLVDARAEDVDPRAQTMTIDPQHDPVTP